MVLHESSRWRELLHYPKWPFKPNSAWTHWSYFHQDTFIVGINCEVWIATLSHNSWLLEIVIRVFPGLPLMFSVIQTEMCLLAILSNLRLHQHCIVFVSLQIRTPVHGNISVALNLPNIAHEFTLSPSFRIKCSRNIWTNLSEPWSQFYFQLRWRGAFASSRGLCTIGTTSCKWTWWRCWAGNRSSGSHSYLCCCGQVQEE